MPLSQPIESYRQPWESTENWELREEFLVQYQDTFEENRLLCLAQAYVNVLLLDCKYPEAVMAQVNTLAKGLDKGESHRQTQAEKAKQNPAKKMRKAQTEQLGTSIKGGWNNEQKRAHRYF